MSHRKAFGISMYATPIVMARLQQKGLMYTNGRKGQIIESDNSLKQLGRP